MVTAKYAILLFHLIKERLYHIKDSCTYNLSISHNERQVYNVSIIYVSLIMRSLFLWYKGASPTRKLLGKAPFLYITQSILLVCDSCENSSLHFQSVKVTVQLFPQSVCIIRQKISGSQRRWISYNNWRYLRTAACITIKLFYETFNTKQGREA